jgi:hypothetical protein
MFRSYDHLQAETYLLELTLLTTDPLLLEHYIHDVVEVFLITTLLIQVIQLLTCFIRNDS